MKIAVFGWGSVGRGAAKAVRNAPDAELYGIFTRRDPSSIADAPAPVFPAADAEKHAGNVDVMLICGGSARDLPEWTPRLARHFCVADSFDTHARAAAHFAAVENAAHAGGTLAVIGAGWDPGLFSAARAVFGAVLPAGETLTFWGPGISRGHSDALRRIDGVADARQFTVPKKEALRAAAEAERTGIAAGMTPQQMHRRECFIVPAPGADRGELARRAAALPDYFAGYETRVTFVSAETLAERYSSPAHTGRVLRTGRTDPEGTDAESLQSAGFALRLGSNADFTGAVLLAAARAVFRRHCRGETGCLTMMDLSPSDLMTEEWEKNF